MKRSKTRRHSKKYINILCLINDEVCPRYATMQWGQAVATRGTKQTS